MRAKIAKSFARIHKANLCNFGILPLTFANPDDYNLFTLGGEVVFPEVKNLVTSGATEIPVLVGDKQIITRLDISERQRSQLAAGGALNLARQALCTV